MTIAISINQGEIVKVGVGYDSPLVIRAQVLSNKVTDIINPCFNALSSCFLFLQGVKEFFYDTRKITQQTAGKTDSWRNILSSKETYPYQHGALLIGTAICQGIDSWQFFRKCTLPDFLTFASKQASLLFVLANLVELEEHIRVYYQTSEGSEGALKRLSAVLGIMSNLGYIATIIFSIMNAASALSIFLGVVSTFSDALQTLIDFFIG